MSADVDRTGSRVVLHVGTPKSGTTFLQRALWHHRDALQEQGVWCPGERQVDLFHGAIDVRGVYERWGFTEERLGGTWARLCAETRQRPGTAVMSHEVLAAATPEQARAALAELDGQDVHVVLTARDLGRQVLSEWQERVKNMSSGSFRAFAATARQQVRRGELTGPLWGYHDVVGILDRWSVGVPPENVHLVVTERGAPPRELWERFAEACGFDPTGLDPSAPAGPGGGGNQSLGRAQIALLREVNARLDKRVPQPYYARVVKRRFSQRLLADQRGERPEAPPQVVADLREVALDWVDRVRERGWTVHGDLDALVPLVPTGDAPHPDDVPAAEVLDSAVSAIAELLVQNAQLEKRAERRARREAPPTPPTPVGRRAAARARRAARRVRDGLRRRLG